jgi:hypothetical protein
MKMRSLLTVLGILVIATLAQSGQGPAGTGACSHVIGPVDSSGVPIGFTCEDVGGSALLVWNAAQLSSNITINGRTPVVNFYPGSFSVSGTFRSDGALAFIGGRISITGSVTGSSILIAGVATSETELKGTLLGPAPSRLVGSTTSPVRIEATGNVKATTGDLVIAGASIVAAGKLSAPKGTAILKAGTKLDIGWDGATWIEGVRTGVKGPAIGVTATGSINAANIVLEAHRSTVSTYSIHNDGVIYTKGNVTFVTGLPGQLLPGGTYADRSFGISNNSKITAATITISPYFEAAPGGSPTDGTFDTTSAANSPMLHSAVGDGFIHPTPDSLLPTKTASVIDSTRAGSSSVIVPQLAASMSHLNATQRTPVTTLAATTTNDQLRGEGKPTAKPGSKPRAKAKPVLVRGAFFGTKISATITGGR